MRIKSIISAFLTLILTFSMGSVAFAQSDAVFGGYTPIYTAENLNEVRNNLSGRYILMNDIDLSDYKSWTPIGNSDAPFTGIFDGDSFTIKNVNVSKVNEESLSVGLFGTVKNSLIKDITVIGKINVNSDGEIRVGLICGEAYNSVISGCRTFGKMNVTTKSGVFVGGIAGRSLSDKDKESEIDLCQNNVSITTTGVCGYELSAFSYFVGGIVGFSSEAISKCSNYGNITAIGKNGGYDYSFVFVGGICGNADGELSDCRNVGNISSKGEKFVFSGGIVGLWTQFGNINGCCNAGFVKADSTGDSFSDIGGIVGYVDSLVFPDSSQNGEQYPAEIRNCYYLNCTEKAFGEANPQSQFNVKSLTAEEFKEQSSFAGLDFEKIWKISATENRPVLRSEAGVAVAEYRIKTGKVCEIKEVGTDGVVSWSTVDKDIAVLKDGGINGLEVGETQIIIFMTDGTALKCNVTVEFSLFWWLINLIFGWIK